LVGGAPLNGSVRQLADMSVINDNPVTYFGPYSNAQRSRVESLLSSLGVHYYFEIVEMPEESLRKWTAWDPASLTPTSAYDLWIHSSDLDKLGTGIVDMFPERKFGAA